MRGASFGSAAYVTVVLFVAACGRGVDEGPRPDDRAVPAEIARAPRAVGVALDDAWHVTATARPEARAVRLDWQLADPTTAGVVQRRRDVDVSFVPSATGNATHPPGAALLVAGRDADGDCVVERWTPGSPVLVDGRAGPAPFPKDVPPLERTELFRASTDAWITDLWPTPLGEDAFLARTFDPATGERALVLARGGRAWREVFDEDALSVLARDPLLLGAGDHAVAGHVHVFATADERATWVLVDPSRTGEAFEADVYEGAMPPEALLDPKSYR